MTGRFRAEALQEMIATARYYDSCGPGVGKRFLDQSHKTLERILEFPRLWPKSRRSARSHRIFGFPYRVIYTRKVDEIVVVAVSHTSRDQKYWKKRLREPEE